MGRILGAHSRVFTFQELHFFEELWSPCTAAAPLDEARGRELLAKLLSRQHRGYLSGDRPEEFESDARRLLATVPTAERTPPELFRRFLESGAAQAGKELACDQTPRNVYYLRELLELYPDCRVVAMTRDPRSVLLSQKNKWKRRSLGATNIPRREAVRSWVNYHPFTITKLWRASTRHALNLASDPRVHLVRFEELVRAPEPIVREVCAHVGLAFEPAMLDVPRVGSSIRPDAALHSDAGRGIDPARAAGFRAGGLTRSELLLCQRAAGDAMARLHYEPEPGRPSILASLCYGALLPIKTGCALLLNLRRMRRLPEAIRRRLG